MRRSVRGYPRTRIPPRDPRLVNDVEWTGAGVEGGGISTGGFVGELGEAADEDEEVSDKTMWKSSCSLVHLVEVVGRRSSRTVAESMSSPKSD
jgi:hypothetical protein